MKRPVEKSRCNKNRIQAFHVTVLIGDESPIQTIFQDIQNTKDWALFIPCSTPKESAQTSLV